jgi:stearoyl-CoA desaturase (delta-9 desaturase)|tara:strand:- start:4471 stop:5202 length:732 start_codon:yes stop_codon:yes gene_type:complete
MKQFEIVDTSRIASYVWIALGHLALLYLVVTWQWQLLLVALGINYVISQIGISLTFHRALAHQSVKLPLWLEVLGSIIGGFAMQGSPLSWAVVHRTHHAHTATEKDPHSPKHLGSWYVTIFGYAFSKSIPKYSIKLMRTWHATFHKYYYPVYGAILIGSLLVLPFETALAIFWAPIAIVFQFENFVNTWLHSWNKDVPVNNHWVQLFVLGEAYHQNHHDDSKRLRFGKYDLVGWIAERLFVKT